MGIMVLSRLQNLWKSHLEQSSIFPKRNPLRLTRWTTAFLVLVFVHCITQVTLQINLRNVNIAAWTLIGRILDQSDLHSPFAVLIPRGTLFVCEYLPRSGETFDEYCTTVWSRDIAYREKGNARNRGLQTTVSPDQVQTLFSMMMAEETPTATSPASNTAVPTPTLAQEANGAFTPGEEGSPGSAIDQNNPQVDDSSQTAVGDVVPGDRGSSRNSGLAPVSLLRQSSQTTPIPSSTPTPGQISPSLASTSTAASPDLPPTSTLLSPLITAESSSTLLQTLSTVTPQATPTTLDIATDVPAETTPTLVATTTAEARKQAPPSSTLDSTSALDQQTSSTFDAPETATDGATEVTAISTSIAETEIASATEVTSSTTITSAEVSSTVAVEFQSTSTQVSSSSPSQVITSEEIAVPTEVVAGSRRRVRALQKSPHRASKRSFMLKREIVLEKLDGNQTMSGIIIQGLNSAPDGTVDVIYLSDNCIEGLNWPHQMLENGYKEDLALVGLHVWSLGVTVIAIFQGSLPHLIAAFIGQIFSTIWSGFEIYRTNLFNTEFNRVITRGACGGVDLMPTYLAKRHPGEVAILVLNCVALVVSMLLYKRFLEDFGAKDRDLLRNSAQMNRVYNICLSLRVFLQLAFFFLVATAALWLDQLYNGPIAPFVVHRGIYQAIFTVTTGLLVPWLLMGWLATCRRMRRTLIVFLALCIVFVLNWSVLLASDVFRVIFLTWAFFACMTLMATILTMLVFILGILCLINFKYRLNYFLDHEQILQDSESGITPFSLTTVPENATKDDEVRVADSEKPRAGPPVPSPPAVARQSNDILRPKISDMLRRWMPQGRRGKGRSVDSSFYSGSIAEKDAGIRRPSSDRGSQSDNPFLSPVLSSPSLAIPNPFSSAISSDGSSTRSFDSTAFQMLAPGLPFAGQDAPSLSGISTPSSALIAPLRQNGSGLDSPHYSDSSRESKVSLSNGLPGRTMLSIVDDPRRPSVATDIQRISIFSDHGPRLPPPAMVEGGGMRSLFSVGRNAAIPTSALPRPARKYSFGLK